MPNGRCRMHGGKSPGAKKGNQYGRKHGIYSDVLSPEDQALYDDIQVGSLDDEIKLCRIQLRRAIIAQEQAKLLEAQDGLELDSFTQSAGMGPKGPVKLAEKKWVRKDYSEVISRLSGRIGKLETQRSLLTGGIPDHPDVDGYVRALRGVAAEVWGNGDAE